MAFTIKELELLSGVKAHTIRIWEQRYHFLKPGRTATNIRTYSNSEVKTLLTVSLLNKHGYKISQIDHMSPEQRSRAVLALNQQEVKQQDLVNRLIGHMVDLDHIRFEKLLNQNIQQHGLLQTVDTVIFHFLNKVGVLWQANRINPAQEHIVSSIIRQKIIAAIDQLPMPTRDEPLLLLFLPEDEHHEIGLLLVYFLLKKNGFRVMYLGANLPLKDLEYIVQIKNPHYLYSHLTSFPRQLQLEKFLGQLSGKAGNATILLSGEIIAAYQKRKPSNVYVLKSLDEVVSYISSL